MSAPSSYDYPTLVAESVTAFADLVGSLDEDQLDTPSLCEGWRVRDVAGHVASGGVISLPAVLLSTAKAGFNVPKASKAGAIAWADGHSAADMASSLRAVAARYTTEPRKGLLKVLKPADLVVDNLIHTQDIRRPLGLGTDFPVPRLQAALAAAPTVKGPLGAAKRARGLRFEATDVEWSWGTGPVVRGSSEAILLGLGGRAAVFAELEGDGVAVLAAR